MPRLFFLIVILVAETTLALLRHPDYCISGYSSVDVKKQRTISGQSDSGFSNDKGYMVITLLVAAEGVHKLPSINSSVELKEALQKLGSILSSQIMAVEVLWTPQSEKDTLSEQELLEDYPHLRPL
ncbi:FLUCTUATING-LIGHT-ACCLIMATION protein 1, chloroplastic-like [Rutidosis leptorrhynchoides]|uniref:FLUCTUATING-LIGHT-ACCLIMATION protein 1, chloroplastic-like n=1 Tax=Rutidosis leptorrhynchoides TaxID=125765 RepID=UPI003A99C044